MFCRDAVGGFQILAGAAIPRSSYARRHQKCPKRHENEKCLPAERRRLAPPSAQGREAFSALLCAIKSLTLLPQIAPWYCVREIFSRHDVSRPAERRRFRATLMRRSGAFFCAFLCYKKLYAYKKLEVRELASADCSKPRSARPGSAAFSRDDLSLNHRGEEKASASFGDNYRRRINV